MENYRLRETNFADMYVADEGFVLTNYKEGDTQIIYSTEIIFQKGQLPEGFYAIRPEEAERIKNSLDTVVEETNNFEHEDVFEDERFGKIDAVDILDTFNDEYK